jgi:hypothetical protein
MLPGFLEFPFLIAPSVLSNVYVFAFLPKIKWSSVEKKLKSRILF